MKKLLRKIFFVDAPAKGTFFGMTALIVLPWMVFAALGVYVRFDFPGTASSLDGWISPGGIFLSTVFLVCAMEAAAGFFSPRTKAGYYTLWGITHTTAALTVILGRYAILGTDWSNNMRDPLDAVGIGCLSVLFCICGAWGSSLWLILQGFFHVIRHRLKKLCLFLCAVAVIICFYTAFLFRGGIWGVPLAIAALPFLGWLGYQLRRSRVAQAIGTALVWVAALDFAISAVICFDSFKEEELIGYYYAMSHDIYCTTICFWVGRFFDFYWGNVWPALFFLSAAAILVAAFLTCRLVAKGCGVPGRALLGKSVYALWGISAVVYLASLGVVLHDRHAYRQVQAALEKEFGCPLQCSSLNRFFPPQPSNAQEFWKDFEAHARGLDQVMDEFDKFDSEYWQGNVEKMQFCMSPAEPAQALRKLLLKSPLPELERRLDQPLPFIQENHRYDFWIDRLGGSDSAPWEAVCKVGPLVLVRLFFALEDQDFPLAQKCFRRMRNIVDWMSVQHAYHPFHGFYRERLFWLKPMVLLSSTPLATEEWLQEQEAMLLAAEARLPEAEQRKHFYVALGIVEKDRWFWDGWHGSDRDGTRFVRGMGSLQWLFPTVGAALIHQNVHWLRGANWDVTTGRKQLAHYRMARGMLMAARLRRQQGVWPAEVKNLPEDPFRPGQPLHYFYGKREVELSVRREEKCEGFECDCKTCTPPCDCGNSRTDYVWRNEPRVIEVVQIWSVGPDGIDDISANRDLQMILWPGRFTGGLRENPAPEKK